MELVVQGLLLGGLYATTALGLSLVFGVIKMVNLAHGEFLIVGAYLTSMLLAVVGGDPLLVAIPAALVIGLLAYPLQRFVLNPLLVHSTEAPITATFGVSVAVQSMLLLAFSSNPRTINAAYSSSRVEILGIGMRSSLLIATIIGVVLVIILGFVLSRTRFGRQVRAAAADPDAAALVGIDVKHTYALVLAVAASVAAIGGTLIALSFSVDPSAGTSWLLRAFTVVVLGGLGSLRGTLVGGFIVGLVETLGAQVFGSQFRDVVVFGLLVVVLLVRPNGLFSKVQRA
ncbi:branched-chain amino acid ABC transporter permease [Agromyces bauzanensis]